MAAEQALPATATSPKVPVPETPVEEQPTEVSAPQVPLNTSTVVPATDPLGLQGAVAVRTMNGPTPIGFETVNQTSLVSEEQKAPLADAVACVVAHVSGEHVEELMLPRFGVIPAMVVVAPVQLSFQGVLGLHSK